ncbi:GH36-type glycosyl hydrolase domain-containing protein [Flavitalea antarctica]
MMEFTIELAQRTNTNMSRKISVFSLFLLLFFTQPTIAQKYGNWQWSAKGLPVYNYTGALPVTASDKNGIDANLPEDPYFLLGNYRTTLITHVSGIYQMLTSERAWARINQAEQPNYGWNDAGVTFSDGSKIALVGVNSIVADPSTQKYFGAGFARYNYRIPANITCTRILSVKPSQKINTGHPAFVITVMLKNNGTMAQTLSYNERMLVGFVLNGTQYTEKEKRLVRYRSTIRIDHSRQTVLADIGYKPATFLVAPKKTERFQYDVDPPSVFMHTAKGSNYQASVHSESDTLSTEVKTTLQPGQVVQFNIVIGLTREAAFTVVQKSASELLSGADATNAGEGLFAALWKSKLPDLASEKNEILRREMLWNAHVMEASAKYSEYYQETLIPQGTVYSYYFGDNISNRDHLQAALPACYTNPELAKSILRYVIKHAEEDGEIKRGNNGFGYTAPSLYKESDEQLYFFNTLAEYLLITRDYAFLKELVAYYPAEHRNKDAVLTVLKKFFVYLRDEIGTGENGLVKMLNSDWSDSFFHTYSPNVYSNTAESHLNSAMVLAVLPKLIQVLRDSKNTEANSFITALTEYHGSIEKAFFKDLGDRKFTARAYLNKNLRFGLDNVCIEPQSYLLQIPSIPTARKKEMYEYIKSKLLSPEKIGIRTREKPLWKGKPDGEDGGIWFSLEYPFLLGVASFDKEEAERLLLKFSFQNFSDNYPDYWVGQWTAADEVNSTLYREGLYAFWVPSQDRKRAFQGFCSHPHTWPLFCYFKLREK